MNKHIYIKKREELLEMSLGKARNIMIKSLLFDLAGKCGLNNCYRCGGEIKNVDDFHIDHKESWINHPNGKKLYFDVNNLAFSHGWCNVAEGGKTQRKIGPEGTSWCHSCETFLPERAFNNRKNRWNGLDYECVFCKSDRYVKTKQKDKT